MARNWKVVGTFVGNVEVTVNVIAPNWVGGIRKGALAIKASEALRGRRLRGGLFSVSEIMDAPLPVANEAEQPSLPGAVVQEAAPVLEVPDVVESESEVPLPAPEELE